MVAGIWPNKEFAHGPNLLSNAAIVLLGIWSDPISFETYFPTEEHEMLQRAVATDKRRGDIDMTQTIRSVIVVPTQVIQILTMTAYVRHVKV